MMFCGYDLGSGPTEASAFANTRWTMVLEAALPPSARGQQALEKLCRTYWHPLYAFLRRRGYESHDAEDLTQAFFERLLEKRFLNAVDRSKGKFRTFLLAALEHFLANQRRDARAQKRGGNGIFLSLDGDRAGTHSRLEPGDDLTPEKIFDRRCALVLLEQTMARLRDECGRNGKRQLFQHLKGVLSGEKGGLSYTAIAAQLGTTEGAMKVAVHRLRQRYGELLREEIAQTVASPEQIDEEIRSLFAALS
jgi:RNA polymerase sigma factor (sigma-70 family)